jgi:hypothetical protein
VSSVTWTVDGDSDGGDVVSISAAAIDAGVASVEVAADNEGSVSLKCTATFADTTTAVAWWKIIVKDNG